MHDNMLSFSLGNITRPGSLGMISALLSQNTPLRFRANLGIRIGIALQKQN